MLSAILLALKGMAMGMAEVVPGVSGGTIAFITGIYERLIDSIKSFNGGLVRLIFKGRFKEAWQHVDGNFLFFLLGGMAAGMVVGVFVITKLLHSHPLLLWAFFFGLILASCVYVGSQLKRWGAVQVLFMIAMAALAFLVTVAKPTDSTDAMWFVALSGMLAISALMLPGLSGSFVLLLLGMYTVVISEVKSLLEGDMASLGLVLVFAVGCLIGLFSFARVLSWAFKYYKDVTLAALTGLMIGSLNKVWPWQQVLETRISSKGVEEVLYSKSVLPGTFSQLDTNFLYGTDPMILPVIGCMLLGIAIVFVLERFGPKEA